MLRGALLGVEGKQAILDVNGVGYHIWATNRDLMQWGSADSPLTVFVSTQVREDAITLYAFVDSQHRRGFEVLLSVSGVGPKVALSALDAMDLTTLRTAIETDDLRSLTAISGVGKKTAQRMALELKGKLPVDFTPGATTATQAAISTPPDPLALALQRLGYNKAEIERTRQRLLGDGVAESEPIATRLKAALATLYREARP
jgi:Holliday junction DNA helicase RuvA